MAQIIKKHLFTLDRETWGKDFGKTIKVGHNRTLRLDSDNYLEFCLHGYSIAQAIREESGQIVIYLDPCGFHTRTTAQAMRDFLRACKIAGSVSFAKGRFTGIYSPDGKTYADMAKGFGVLFFNAPEDCRLCGK